MSYWEKDEPLCIPLARRVQQAMIVATSTLLGGQRAQCIQHLTFSCLVVTAEEGTSIQLPREKTQRIYASALPIPAHLFNLLKWYIAEIRPLLMSKDQVDNMTEWLQLRRSGLQPQREEELYGTIIHNLWIK